MGRFFTVLCIFLYTSVGIFGQTNLKKHVSWHRPTIPSEIWYTDSQGRQQGTHTFYARNGKIELTQQFVNDVLDGKACSYYENGKAATEWIYRKGVMSKMVSYAYISFNNQPAIYVKQSIINLDNDGEEIEKWKISYATKQLVQVKGTLSDGRKWALTTPCTANKVACEFGINDKKSDSYRMYNSYMEEPINKSDTIYVWYDKSKAQLQSKSIYMNVPTLSWEDVSKGKFYRYKAETIWSPDGILISDGIGSTLEVIQIRTEQNYNDSIARANR